MVGWRKEAGNKPAGFRRREGERELGGNEGVSPKQKVTNLLHLGKEKEESIGGGRGRGFGPGFPGGKRGGKWNARHKVEFVRNGLFLSAMVRDRRGGRRTGQEKKEKRRSCESREENGFIPLPSQGRSLQRALVRRERRRGGQKGEKEKESQRKKPYSTRKFSDHPTPGNPQDEGEIKSVGAKDLLPHFLTSAPAKNAGNHM